MVDISRGWKTSLALCLWLGSTAAWVGCGPADDEVEDELGAASEAARVSRNTCTRWKFRCHHGDESACSRLIPSGCVAPPNGQCTDTDGGRIPAVRGTVTDYRGETFRDDCVLSGPNAGWLRENYCSSRGAHGTYLTQCPHGCRFGRCQQNVLVSPITCEEWRLSCQNGDSRACSRLIPSGCDPPPFTGECTDTDGGRKPFVRGTLTDAGGKTHTDDCIESGTYAGYVREHYCTARGTYNMYTTKCAYGCAQGRCKSAPVCTGTDEDGCSCKPGETLGCNSRLPGICGAGTQSCSSDRTWGPCSALTQPGAVQEDCGNGKDDDCDGKTDGDDSDCAEDGGVCTPGAAEACDSGLPGICSAGTQTCSSGGSWGSCSALIRRGTVPEDCGNGKDDDCDGDTDGDDSDCVVSCPAGEQLQGGVCVVSCPAGSYNQGGECVCAANHATVGSTCKPVIDIYRFRSAVWTDYLFTASKTEVSSSGAGNYRAESGGNFKVFQRNEGGMRALRRCSVSVGSGADHFLSTSSTCEGPVGRSDGGVLGYIDSPLSGSQCAAHRKPLYRCFSLAHHMHLTTTRLSECTVATDPANRPADKLVYEGLLGCVPTD